MKNQPPLTPQQMEANKKAFKFSALSYEMYELLTQVQNHELPEHLQKEIAHVLFTINTQTQ
jgi:hypothetical protein